MALDSDFPFFMQRLLLVRHASTAAIRAGRFGCGEAEPLDEVGKREVAALEPVFERFGAGLVVSSPSLRCRQTASVFSGKKSEVWEELREREFGNWAGETYGSLAEKEPEAMGRFFRFNGEPDFAPPRKGEGKVESNREFWLRAVGVAEKIQKSPEERIGVVSHGGFLRALVCCLLSLDAEKHFFLFDFAPATCIEILLHAEGGTVLRHFQPAENQEVRI